MKALARKRLFLLIYLGLTALFSFAYYDSYLRHIDCFNELGRCFEPDTGIVYTIGGMAWGLFATVFAALSLLSILRLVLHRR